MSPSGPTLERPGRAHPVRRRAAVLSVAALALAIPGTAVAAPPSAPVPMTLPAPTGHHHIGTTTLHLVDPSRPDPWVPGDPTRELMVQLWYPTGAVAGYPKAPYWTPATARAYEQDNGFPVLPWPITDGQVDAPVARHPGGWPVVLFSPALGGERTDTTVEVEDLASRGYVVATIDHVHDSGIVELPGGRVETVAVPEPTKDTEVAQSTKEVDARAADTSFVLDQLTALDHGANPDHEHRALPAGLRGAFDLDEVGMFGHSDGGSTTAHELNADPRIKAGVDLDGTLWTPQAVAGSHRPLLLFGRQSLDPFEASTWAEFARNQRGPHLQLSLAGSVHHTFTDFAALVPQLAKLLGFSAAEVTQFIGTIDGSRAVTIERAYLDAWFDRYLRHRDDHLLRGPSPRFPEVTFVS